MNQWLLIFCLFMNNSPEGEQLYFAVSRDGYNYIPLNDGKRIVNLDDIARWKCIRDPHILRGHDRKLLYGCYRYEILCRVVI